MNLGTFQSPIAKLEAQAAAEWILAARTSWSKCGREWRVAEARKCWRLALYSERRWAACLESSDTDPDEPDELTEETMVRWVNDGEAHWVRFGSLHRPERKTVEWDAQRGHYVGGYPF